MQDLAKNIQIDLIIPNMKVNSKKEALETLSEKAAALCGLKKSELLELLSRGEGTANPGIGDGVAIPHAKSDRIDKPFIAFARLDLPIPYNAVDDEPVSLICAVFSPAHEGSAYLQRLSRISRLLRRRELRLQLQNAKNENAIRAVFESALADWAIAA